jgi:hypothetical protein
MEAIRAWFSAGHSGEDFTQYGWIALSVSIIVFLFLDVMSRTRVPGSSTLSKVTNADRGRNAAISAGVWILAYKTIAWRSNYSFSPY